MTDKDTITMEQAIIKVFRNKPNKEFTIKDICFGFLNYYGLSGYQKENDPKYPQPRWHHEIRSLINKLVQRGIVKKIMWNCYKYGKT
ncbi:MAG TPA: hypothetical protein ENH82_19790 [bacterium]|nr:hypothetical protein [bacterium]